MSYCPFNVPDQFNFTGRCWCWYDTTTLETKCSIPGPTLIMYNGTSFTLTVTNSMTGSDEICETCHNQPKDPDITNLHTHGLHVSGDEDDPFIYILPNNNYYNTYNVEILSTHYPGTHWYHSHWHGSVTYQLSTGAFGALIVKNDQQDNSDYQDINLYNMKSYTIVFSWIWGLDKSDCDCDDDIEFIDTAAQFSIPTQCDIWCTMDSTQRSLSGAQYDMVLLGDTSYTSCTTDRRRSRNRRRMGASAKEHRRRLLQGGGGGGSGGGSGGGGGGGDPSGCTPQETTHSRQYYLVNGQFEPIIDDTHSNGKWYVDEWRIFRLIGAQTEHLFQFYFDTYDNTCQYYLLSRDGVYLDRDNNNERNLCNSPYDCYFFLQSGGRADIAIKCDTDGEYEINLSQTNYYDFFPEFPRAYETTSDNFDSWNDFLFKFTIYPNDESNDYLNRFDYHFHVLFCFWIDAQYFNFSVFLFLCFSVRMSENMIFFSFFVVGVGLICALTERV